MAKELNLNGNFQIWLFRTLWTALVAAISIIVSGAIFQNSVEAVDDRVDAIITVDAVLKQRVDSFEDYLKRIERKVDQLIVKGS